MKKLQVKFTLIALLIFALPVLGSNSQEVSKDSIPMAMLITQNFDLAQRQYKYMMALTPKERMPQSYDAKNDKFKAYGITWWCSGFYPGNLWLIYEQTKDSVIRGEAERALKVIESNQKFTGNHDLGFMMYCSYGNAYRCTNNKHYIPVILESSRSLLTRYRPTIKAIQSWDKGGDLNCPVIIDNMMNLEMLLWAAQHGGTKEMKQVALTHANTTMKNHFRTDYSSYHVLDYDLTTGNVLAKKTAQGYSDASAWARGQSWGLYGYVVMYRFTKNNKYLDQAKKIALFILNNPALPADKVPFWDFNDPKIPNVPRDASAGAIMASALLELGQYSKGAEKNLYVSVAETILRSLSNDFFRAKPETNGGFLLKHSTGSLPVNSEVDVPLIYADYYFLEALKRYKDWYLK